MVSKNRTRRLERLEAERMPGKEDVLIIEVERIGEDSPIRTIELRLRPPARRRQGWVGNR